VDGPKTAKVARNQSVQQLERLGAANSTDENPVRPMTQRRAEQLRDRHWPAEEPGSKRRLSASDLAPTGLGLSIMISDVSSSERFDRFGESSWPGH
jgi:hypothetical protein